MEQAAVVWCVLNRVDDGGWGDTIEDVVTAPEQFHGYDEGHPVDGHLLWIACDVLSRWEAERLGHTEVGRVLPREYLYFASRNKRNRFRKEYGSRDHWEWSLRDPYAEVLV